MSDVHDLAQAHDSMLRQGGGVWIKIHDTMLRQRGS